MADRGPDDEGFELINIGFPQEVQTMIGEVEGVGVWWESDDESESVEALFGMNIVDAVFPGILGGDVVKELFGDEDFWGHTLAW